MTIESGAEHRRLDRGETTTQMVLVLPVVLTILMIAIQASLYFHTSNVAGAAASQGASAATAQGQTDDAVVERATRAANDVLVQSRALLATPMDVQIVADLITVAVEVRVPRIAPFFPTTVRRTASEPRERFLTEAMR